MLAAIDVGSNTIRMLIGECCDGAIVPHSYHRNIARLAGNFSLETGLSDVARDRVISILELYQKTLISLNITAVHIVGTAALRRAKNRQYFLSQVLAATGFEIEVIAGRQEALLTTVGVLSVCNSSDKNLMIIDIGGGSTEITAIVAGKIQLHESYPLGVVGLCEECSSVTDRQQQIDLIIKQFAEKLRRLDLAAHNYLLVGTAGTVTTLAAIHLQLEKYNPELINNHELSVAWLESVKQKLESMSVLQRESLPGMEQGRGNLIIPGLEIILAFLKLLQLSHLKVVDAGLLEGVFLNGCNCEDSVSYAN